MEMFTTQEIEVFLAVSEHLHFGAAADQLYLSPPRVSRVIAELERRIGAALFERTSRGARLTAIGRQLKVELTQVYAGMQAALMRAQRAAGGIGGTLRIGIHSTTGGGRLLDLLRDFTDSGPDRQTQLIEISIADLYRPLLEGTIDVLSTWRTIVEADGLEMTEAVDLQERRLAVARHHPLAGRESLSIEEVADWPLLGMAPPFPEPLLDTFIPRKTPGGRELHRTTMSSGFLNTVELIALGGVVHLTVESFGDLVPAHRVALVPVHDLPPIERVLAWRRGTVNPMIAELASYV